MILPPEAAANCPQADIVGVLNRLEGLTRVRYCQHCFGVSQKCRCSAIPHQAPSPTSALWTPPTVSYAAMVSSTVTTASTSVARITPLSYPPPGMPPLEPMDTLPAPTSENLLATAGVGRGGRGQRQPSTPMAPGLRQTRPAAPQQQMPAPEGRGQTRRLLTNSRCTCLDAPLEYERPPLNKAPPLAPVRAVLRQPEKAKTPEVGLHPEGLKANTGKTDPPPEDPGNAGKAPRVMIPWTRCLTTWPQDVNKTSRT